MGIEELEEKENVVLPQHPVDRDACDRIEQAASVVAWTPAAELFLRQIMLGNQDFEFMNAESVYYAYYRLRVDVLRRRPCRLYSLRG